MEPEKEVGLLDVIREFNRLEIRYLIIGRRAVILYGALEEILINMRLCLRIRLRSYVTAP